MSGDRFRGLGPLRPGGHLLAAWRLARVKVAAALGSYGVVVVLVGHAEIPALLTAIAATATFAAVWIYGEPHGTAAQSVPAVFERVVAAALTAGGVALGTLAIAGVAATAAPFYCAPAVPWRIEIAMFGGFVVGLLTGLARASGRFNLIYPLTLIMLCWIAPFYGYFSGPILLGMDLVVECTNRSSVQVAASAFGVSAGAAIGSMLAQWLLKRSIDRRA